jgi:hypothetical protein
MQRYVPKLYSRQVSSRLPRTKEEDHDDRSAEELESCRSGQQKDALIVNIRLEKEIPAI